MGCLCTERDYGLGLTVYPVGRLSESRAIGRSRPSDSRARPARNRTARQYARLRVPPEYQVAARRRGKPRRGDLAVRQWFPMSTSDDRWERVAQEEACR